MAEEVKKIITVEVGKSITSIRDFKKHIDDLRGSLLGLNEESEEYKTIAEQIATDQAKLNDVMKIGKTNTDSAAGSYVDLNNQLKALRNQYKALSETERNSASGQAILQNITRLDTQLKDIDESMGQYQRNVGNYKQAFESVFSSISSEVGKINPTLGNILSAIQKLIPAFKGVGTAAKGAGTSIRAAMASTGIGLLVVALGEIIAHWEQISNWATRVLGIQKDITSETKNTAEAAQELADRFKDALDYQNQLARARGEDPLTTLKKNIKEYQDEIDRLEEAEKRIGDFQSKISQAFSRNIQDSMDIPYWQVGGTYVNEAKEDIAELYNTITDYEKGLMGYVKDTGKLIELRNRLTSSSAHEVQKVLVDLSKFLDQQNQINEEAYVKQRANLDEENKKYQIAQTTFITQTENRFMSESELRTKRYEEEKKLIDENIKDEAKKNEALLNLQKEYERDMAKIREDAWKQSKSYENLQKDLQDIKAIQDRLKNQGKDEMEILQENHDKEVELINKYHDLGLLKEEQYIDLSTKLEEEYWKNKLDIIYENAKEIEEAINGIVEEIQNSWREAYQKDLDAQELFEAQAISAVSNRLVNGKSTAGDSYDDIMNERQKEDEIFMIQKAGYEARIQAHQDYLLLLNEGDQEYLDIQRQIAEEEIALADLVYNHQVELDRREIQLKEEKKRAIITLASNTASVYSSFTDIMLAEEEQGSSKWKAFKTSEAVVNMLSGVLAAFMSGFNSPLPAPWNIALATSTAAVAAAAGAAQIAQINATKMGSTSSASNAITGGSGASSVGVSPLLNPDYDLQRLTNLSLQSDAFLPGNTQVYVLESDIQEVGNRVQVRENNATF